MRLTDSTIIEVLFIALLFGSLPAAFIFRAEEPYSVYGFIFISVIAYSVTGLIGQAWILFILVPIAWAWALKPVYDKYKAKTSTL